jgi:hypothetical protein
MGLKRRMPRACRRMEHLRAGASIHGKLGQGIGHFVMRAHVVSPVAHIMLIREESRLRVKAKELGVLGRSILTELVKDKRTVADHLEVGQAVIRCRLHPLINP